MAKSEITVTITLADLAERIQNGFLARVEYEEWQGHLVAWPYNTEFEEQGRSMDGDYLMIKLPEETDGEPTT